MTESSQSGQGQKIVDMLKHREEYTRLPSIRGGGSGSGGGNMEQRVIALEAGMNDIKIALKEIQASQQVAAIKAAEQTGDLNVRFSDIKSGFAGVDTRFAEILGKIGTLQGQFDGKLSNLQTQSDSLRRDIEKLPTEYGVAKIMVFVIGGLGTAAALIKVGWPYLSKLFGP